MGRSFIYRYWPIIVITKLIVGMDLHIFKIAGKSSPANNLQFLYGSCKCRIGISQYGFDAEVCFNQTYGAVLLSLLLVLPRLRFFNIQTSPQSLV